MVRSGLAEGEAMERERNVPLGRRPLSPGKRRDEFVGVRFTIAERWELAAAAKRHNLSLSEFIRDRALEAARRLAKKKS